MKQNRIFHPIHYSALACLLALLSARAAYAYTGTQGHEPITIEPGDTHEVCMQLTPPQQLRYAFTATDELAFNIHYHANHQVVYPLAEHPALQAKATFTPESGQHYCLMWTNNSNSAVELSLQQEILPGP